jgi:hypothetical protein
MNFRPLPTAIPSSQRPHGTNPAGLQPMSPGSLRLNTTPLKLTATWSGGRIVSLANGATGAPFSMNVVSVGGIVIAFNNQKRVLWFIRHYFPWLNGFIVISRPTGVGSLNSFSYHLHTTSML